MNQDLYQWAGIFFPILFGFGIYLRFPNDPGAKIVSRWCLGLSGLCLLILVYFSASDWTKFLITSELIITAFGILVIIVIVAFVARVFWDGLPFGD